jgi:hypothetical protein
MARLSRFIITLNGEELTRVPSIPKVAEYLGCSKVYVYNACKDGILNYQGKTYRILDLLVINNERLNNKD